MVLCALDDVYFLFYFLSIFPISMWSFNIYIKFICPFFFSPSPYLIIFTSRESYYLFNFFLLKIILVSKIVCTVVLKWQILCSLELHQLSLCQYQALVKEGCARKGRQLVVKLCQSFFWTYIYFMIWNFFTLPIPSLSKISVVVGIQIHKSFFLGYKQTTCQNNKIAEVFCMYAHIY